MKIYQLDSKAYRNAIEIILGLIKGEGNYQQFFSGDELKEYAEKNNLLFDGEGYLI